MNSFRKKEKGKKSQGRLILDRFLKNKAAVMGFCVMAVMLGLILISSIFCRYQLALDQQIILRYSKPSFQNGLGGLLGYDSMGRSLLWRILFGGRITLLASFAVVALALVVGGFLGALCGLLGGRVDQIIMRIMDLFMCIPYILMAMTIVAALGTSMINIVIALALATIPAVARVVRASVLTVRDMDYIEASYVSGAGKLWVIMSHILPNAIGPIIVYGTMLIANQILSISALSFLGLGAQPPTPEWGYMISDAKNVLRQYPLQTVVPGIVIILSVLSINLIGDGLQAALDPRLK